jgi:hypothetical protein
MSSGYAGIGARGIPAAVRALIESVAAELAQRGWVLRTGLSPGADQAFYRGAHTGGGQIELYLPWAGFEAHARDRQEERVRVLECPLPAAFELAACFHRAWDGRTWRELSEPERARLARDAHQVLGASLDCPVLCVVCFTPDGGLDGEDPRAQGTGQALRIAADRAIPVLNLARPEHVRRARELALPA